MNWTNRRLERLRATQHDLRQHRVKTTTRLTSAPGQSDYRSVHDSRQHRVLDVGGVVVVLPETERHGLHHLEKASRRTTTAAEGHGGEDTTATPCKQEDKGQEEETEAAKRQEGEKSCRRSLVPGCFTPCVAVADASPGSRTVHGGDTIVPSKKKVGCGHTERGASAPCRGHPTVAACTLYAGCWLTV